MSLSLNVGERQGLLEGFVMRCVNLKRMFSALW